jgi:hypothetical protein
MAKQQVSYKGIDKSGKVFLHPMLEHVAMNSTVEPVPVNRKSRKAMAAEKRKVISEIVDAVKPEHIKANRKQKAKAKAARKSARLSNGLNRAKARSK